MRHVPAPRTSATARTPDKDVMTRGAALYIDQCSNHADAASAREVANIRKEARQAATQ